MRYQRAESPLKLDSLAAAREFFAGCLADGDPTREELWVAHVDDEARCVHLSRYLGDETGTEFPLKAIISDAAAHRSAGLVLAHNHPSGDGRPSEADFRTTKRLAIVAEAMGCKFIDHLIFAGGSCESLRARGYV